MNMIEGLRRRIAVLLALHERPVSRFLKKMKGHIFVDVGANYGYYPMLLHKNFVEIYAFEHVPSIFEELRSNMKKFDNVKCIRRAVSDADGESVKVSYHGFHGFAQTVTLASLFPNVEIDLVKVDAEGGEWDVLKGAGPAVERIKSWVVELHNPNRKNDLENWFTSRGYLVRWVDFAYRGSKTANHIYAWRE